MHCDQAEELLSARLDGELQLDDRAMLDAHLHACSSCRSTAAAVRVQNAELRQLFSPRRQRAATIAERVLARLPATPAPRPNQVPFSPQAVDPHRHARRVAAVLLAMAALLALTLILPHLFHPGPPAQPPIARSQPPQHESALPATHPGATKTPGAAIGTVVRTGVGERRSVRLSDGSVLYLNQNSVLKIDAERLATLEKGEVYVEVAPRRQGTPNATFRLKTPKREITALGTRFDVRANEQGTGVLVTQGKVRATGVASTLHAGQEVRPGAGELLPTPRVSHLLDWARDLIAGEAVRLVPVSRYGGGALIGVDPYGQASQLTLRRYHIDVHIEDGFARTTIDQTYFNADNWRMEGTFYFPLPPAASLSRLAMYVDGRLMEGGMAERDFARNVYEQILYRQRDPALLEWIDGSTFKMRVFPLEPRQEKRLVLSYTQRLETLYGQTRYRFPAGQRLPIVRDWSFHAFVKHGAALGWACSSHTLKAHTVGHDLLLDGKASQVRPDRDVVLDLSEDDAAPAVRFSSAVQDGTRYLMLRYRPTLGWRAGQTDDLSSRPHRDWVFLFESSGDRDSLLARTQTAIIRTLLANTEHDDTFTILAAGTRVHAFPPHGTLAATPDNIEEAVSFLERSRLIGALDLGHALEAAGPMLQAAKNPWLVHVGSGVAAMGEKRAGALAAKLPEGTHYVGIGVGKRWNRSFMKLAAERTGGYFTQINPDEQIAWRAFDLLATLNTPRLLNVHVVDNAEQCNFLTFTSLVAQGEELAAVARLEPGQALPQTLTVAGRLEGQPWQQVLPVQGVAEHADYLPRTWARLKIEELLTAYSHDPNGSESDREHQRKTKEQIIALSKAMYVMTPFTSLLVLENDEMYARFKVDRDRKDHWAKYPLPKKIPVVTEPDSSQPATLKGKQKPTIEQVLQTILVRVPAPFLTWSGEQARFQGQAAVNALQLFSNTAGTKERETFATNGFLSGISTGVARRPAGVRFARALDFQFYSDRPEAQGQFVAGEFALSANPALFSRQLAATGPSASPASDGASVVPIPALGSLMLAGTANAKQDEMVDQSKHYVPSISGRTVVAGDTILSSGQDLAPLGEQYPDRLALGDSADKFGPPILSQLPTINRLEFKELAQPAANYLGLINATPNPSSSVVGPRGAKADLWPALAQAGGLYQRPTFSGDDRVFYDLVAYAPGMNTSRDDILAVLDAEALPTHRIKRGSVTPAARRLIDRARQLGWQNLTILSDAGQPDLQVVFNGRGQFRYERVVGVGLHEKVICDGKTLLHLYPDLGIGARRTVSRFHRASFTSLLPWFIPPAGDLTHGMDVTCADNHTVAIAPVGAATARDAKGKPIPYRCLHLLFSPEGRLAERQLVAMPEQKVLARLTYASEGTVRVLDGKGKVLAEEKWHLEPAAAPDLKPNTKGLVVLPLPWRTREHVIEAFTIPANPNMEDMPEPEALALFAADLVSNTAEALQLFNRRFYSRDLKWLGFYTLLAAVGINVDAEQNCLNLMAEHSADPLARYLAFHSNPELRRHAHWGELNSPAQGMLHRLAAFRVLWMHWQAEPATGGSEAERQHALQFVRDNHSQLGWTLLGLLQQKAGKQTKFLTDIAAAYHAYAPSAGQSYLSRYEEARSLLLAQRRAEARRLFRTLYAETLKHGIVPPIDTDFRLALQSHGQLGEAWTPLVRETAHELVKEKHRLLAIALAWQCWQLDDQALADNALAAALEGLPAGDGRLLPTLAAIEFLLKVNQPVRADDLLRPLLADKHLGDRPDLWRLGMRIAQARKQTPRSLACLERALALEARQPPPVIDLQQVRNDYGALLEHYQQVVDAMATLQVKPPTGFADRVVRAADRWRELDHDNATACQAAGKILESLGQKELAWEFLTTPIGLQPNEAGPWVSLAQSERTAGDYDLADRAYLAAFESEPTDAQIVWERAQTMQQAGRRVEAQKLYRQLAEGHWQPRFAGLQSQARWQLENR